MDEIDFAKDVSIVFLSTSALLLTVILIVSTTQTVPAPNGTLGVSALSAIASIALIGSAFVSANYLTQLLETNKLPESPERTQRLRRMLINQGTVFIIGLFLIALLVIAGTHWVRVGS